MTQIVCVWICVRDGVEYTAVRKRANRWECPLDGGDLGHAGRARDQRSS